MYSAKKQPPTEAHRAKPPGSEHPFAPRISASAIITQVLATLGLASLFDKSIDWSPIIQHAIEVYRLAVYPLFDKLTFFLPAPIPAAWKDFFTANLIVFSALGAATNGTSGPTSLFSLTYSSFKDAWAGVFGSLKKSEARSTTTKAIGSLILNVIITVFFGLMMVALSWALYSLLALYTLRRYLSAKDPEQRREHRQKLVLLFASLVRSFYFFVALLGIDYALGLSK